MRLFEIERYQQTSTGDAVVSSDDRRVIHVLLWLSTLLPLAAIIATILFEARYGDWRSTTEDGDDVATGGEDASVIDTSGFTGPVTLDGGAGGDVLIGGDGGVCPRLKRSDSSEEDRPESLETEILSSIRSGERADEGIT